MQFTQAISNNPAAWASASSSALNSAGTIAQGFNASNNSNYNAALLTQQAKTVALQTGSQTSQIRRQGSQVLADQSAGFADNGTGTGGSNAALQRSTAIDTETDAMNADYNGRLQIADINNQATALRATAKAQKPGLISLLGGVNSAVGSYYNTSSLVKR
ncbi:hypothetical protein M2403_002045 [Rahnella sp. BIGb0603]|uniref:hypothetical protein n=1 Tax=Rahnella sp. BIGb0603 TaxID=2940612 RepID=UPI00216755F2|nr:hypothetical protein [Rahnella sp. BIGb0603]MCS3423444.1 hypothetical protein [Rahnella sp. BIGb0603]